MNWGLNLKNQQDAIWPSINNQPVKFIRSQDKDAQHVYVKTSKLTQFAKDLGTTPSSRFPLRFRVSNDKHLEMYQILCHFVCFSSNPTPLRVLLISIKHWGIVSFKVLYDRSRIWRYVVPYNERGLPPRNLLFEREKK